MLNPDRWTCDPAIKFGAGSCVKAVAFSANGKYLWSGGNDEVQVWRVEDGRQAATLGVIAPVLCLSVSKDGKWAAAGTSCGVLVWEAETYRPVSGFDSELSERDESGWGVNGVDFSPNLPRFVSASNDKTATIWDLQPRKRAWSFLQNGMVFAAKYSPKGDQIATAAGDSIRVYDSSTHRFLAKFDVIAIPYHNTGLLFPNNHLFSVCHDKIKQFEPSTKSLVSEWLVPDANQHSSIAMSKHGEFIIHSTKHTVSFWDVATHAQLDLIQQPGDINSIAISPDDSLIAVAGEDGKISINRLFCINVSFMSRSIMAFMNTLALRSFFSPSNLMYFYTLHSRNQTFGLTTLRLILGSMTNSCTHMNY